MNYYNGTGSSLQIGKETIYGTGVTPTNQLAFLSESLKHTVNRITEDTLLAGKTVKSMDVMSYAVAGDIQVILKPENLKQLLYLAMGVEENPALLYGTTGVYEHEFTLIDADTSGPSFSVVVDRKAAIFRYPGCKISSLKLDAKAGDYIRATASVLGSGEEEAGTLASLPIPSKKAFRFVNGSLTIDTVEFAQVTSVSLTIDNQMTEGDQTLGSGYFREEAEHAERMVKINLDAYYNSASNTVRENKYKTDGATAAIVLTFESPEEIETDEKYQFTVELPNVVIDDATANVGGKDKIMIQLAGTALETSSVEAITVTVRDDEDEKSFV